MTVIGLRLAAEQTAHVQKSGREQVFRTPLFKQAQICRLVFVPASLVFFEIIQDPLRRGQLGNMNIRGPTDALKEER